MVKFALLATVLLLAPGIRWENTFRGARASGKPVLVLYTSEGCGACRDLETKTLTDARVIDRINRFFAPIHFQATSQDPVRWVPTILVLDRNGRIQRRIEGYVTPDELLARLKEIR